MKKAKMVLIALRILAVALTGFDDHGTTIKTFNAGHACVLTRRTNKRNEAKTTAVLAGLELKQF